MELWQRILQQPGPSLEEIAGRFGLSGEELHQVAAAFRFRVTPYYYSLIEEKDDGIYRQCIPDPAELTPNRELEDDPLGEEKHNPAPGVIHRYPDRCLLLVSNRCATYCRFCTRKRKFRTPMCVDRATLDAGIGYIERTLAIRDVLLTGGDPFLLADEELEYFLAKIRAIPHVDFIRIGTRTPCVLPQRITAKLVKMLKKFHPLYLNLHFNHPREVNPVSTAALNRLADAGIPLGSQTVLLKGVNDDPEILKELFYRLLKARVHPYYLFQNDLVYGTGHFRVPLERALQIMAALRGRVSGMAMPHFAVDLPHGGGKVPLEPDYLCRRDDRGYVFRNFEGIEWDYPELREP